MAQYSTCSYTIEVDRVGLRDYLQKKREEEKERKEEEEERIRRGEEEIELMLLMREKVREGFFLDVPVFLGNSWTRQPQSTPTLLEFFDECIDYISSKPFVPKRNNSTSTRMVAFEEEYSHHVGHRLLREATLRREKSEKEYRNRFEPVVYSTLRDRDYRNWASDKRNEEDKRRAASTIITDRLKTSSEAWIRDEIKLFDEAAEKAAEGKRLANQAAKRAAAEKERERRRKARERKREKDIISRQKQYQKLVGPIPKKRKDDDKWIQAELVKAEKEAKAHSKKLSKFFKDQEVSKELQRMVKREWDTPIDDVAYIHVKKWISHPNMHPIIHSILNKRTKGLTVDDGDYLFRYREHKVLLEALGAGKKSMDWAKQLLESGFADNVEAMEMVVDGMSVAAARKAYGLGPGPDPTPDPIPDIVDDDYDPDDDDNVLLL